MGNFYENRNIARFGMKDGRMSTSIRRNGSAWPVLCAMGAFAFALSAHAASFDCAKAGTKVEKMICGDAELSKLDEELNAAYKAALQVKQQADSIKQAQKQWMKERNGCSDAVCVKRAYETRLSSITVTQTSAGNIQSAKDNSQTGQQYHFQLTKGKGVPVCDAYLERLNTTKYEKPPYCDRPENDAVTGFVKLNRVPLLPADIHDLFPIISTYMSLANQKNLDWTDMNLQQRLTQTGQDRLTEANSKSLIRDLDGGWAKIWGYAPRIDIDNDGVPDNVEVWHGSTLRTGVGGTKCGEYMLKLNIPSLRQPQVAFVVTANNDRLDVSKTVNVFAHPSGGYRLSDGTLSTPFRPVGMTIGIFKYRDSYYFDTFFDGWGDFENKRQKDKNISNTLAVFLHKDGKTRQVCEYLMTDNETQAERGIK